MEPSKSFHVLIGAPAFLDHLPHGPCLVIDADQSRLDQLKREYVQREHPYPCSTRCAVLTAEPHTSLQWFTYTDRRFDGVLRPETWSGYVNNLSCLLEETLAGSTLESLLEEANLPLEEHHSGCIAIRQGDPLAVVAGAGGWRDRIQTVELLSPDAERHWDSVMTMELEPYGFRHLSGQSHWQRPDKKMLLFQLERLQQQRADLVAERDEQLSGRQELAERLEQQQKDMEKLVQERDEQLSGRQELAERLEQQQKDMETLIQERDEQLSGRQELAGRLEQQQKDMETLIQERDEQLSGRQELAGRLEQHQKELELVLCERDALKDQIEELQADWAQKENDMRMRSLQQEAFARASSAKVGLISDLIARWGEAPDAR